jgi:large-conductance mechanosensitive channel
MVKKNKNSNNWDYSDIISEKAYRNDSNKLFSATVIFCIIGFLILAFVIFLYWAFGQALGSV